jgi:hypothetical protein
MADVNGSKSMCIGEKALVGIEKQVAKFGCLELIEGQFF